MLPGIANLSIGQYALGAAAANLPSAVPEARVSATAFILSGVLVVATLAIATWRLMRLELPGDTD